MRWSGHFLSSILSKILSLVYNYVRQMIYCLWYYLLVRQCALFRKFIHAMLSCSCRKCYVPSSGWCVRLPQQVWWFFFSSFSFLSIFSYCADDCSSQTKDILTRRGPSPHPSVRNGMESYHCIVMLFVLITIMLGFSFIQYTNTWRSHKAFFITRDIDI